MDPRELENIIDEVAKFIKDEIENDSIITHEDLEDKLNIDICTEKEIYYTRVIKLKKHLKDLYGIFLKTKIKVGYIKVSPKDSIYLCTGKAKQLQNGMKKVVEDITKIRIDEIKDPKDRNNTIEESNRLGSIYGMMKHGMKQNYIKDSK